MKPDLEALLHKLERLSMLSLFLDTDRLDGWFNHDIDTLYELVSELSNESKALCKSLISSA